MFYTATAPWLSAGLREAGWLEEATALESEEAPQEGGGAPASDEVAPDVVAFDERDVKLVSALGADMTLAILHTHLDTARASARQHMDSPTAQNMLCMRVRRVLSCAAEAALLARRACRCASRILQGEHVLLFRFDPSSLALWRCASSASDVLPSRSAVVNPRAPRGIAALVATTGQHHASDAPSNDRALLPGFDAPDGLELDDVLAVPLRSQPTGKVVGVLQVLNRRRHGSPGATTVDGPFARAVAGRFAGIASTKHSVTAREADLPQLVAWETATLQMVADETAAAFDVLACQQKEAEEEPRPPVDAALVEALCAAERRLAAAEVKVALIRAASLDVCANHAA